MNPVSYPIPAFESKVLPLNFTDDQLIKALQALEKPIVFTNGVFDILHRGHVTYLAQAKSLGASLVVGVNADVSVRMLGKDIGYNRMGYNGVIDSYIIDSENEKRKYYFQNKIMIMDNRDEDIKII